MWLGYPFYASNMNNRQTHFAATFHNQTFVGSSFQSSMQSIARGAVFSGTQHDSHTCLVDIS